MIVELKPEEWNQVINIVAQAPYSQVANLIQSIVAQCQQQQPAQAQAPQAAATTGNGQG